MRYTNCVISNSRPQVKDLGLTDGETYALAFFLPELSIPGSPLDKRTRIERQVAQAGTARKAQCSDLGHLDCD